MKTCGDGRAATLLAASMCTLLFGGCGDPTLSEVGEDEHELEIERIDLGDRVDGARLGDLESAGTFDVGVVEFERAFDRVALTWESTEKGAASLEVRAAGEWTAVTVSHAEHVPETGVTLYAGHADVPAGTTAIEARVSLTRGGAASPRIAGLEAQAFVLNEIADSGEPIAPGDLDDSDYSSFTTHFAQPAIIGRADWGAKPPLCKGATHTPRRITYHHTVTANGEFGAAAKARLRQLQASHQEDMGWCDIGFHFLVDSRGKIYRGRNTTRRTGNHVPNHNKNNLGVAMLGKFATVTPPADQLKGLMNINAFLADYWDITPTSDRILGHRSWSSSGTGCPGAKAFAKRGAILSGIQSRLKPSGPRVSDFVSSSCTTTSVRPLSEQLIGELNCMVPGAVKKIPSDNQFAFNSSFPYLQTRPANRLPMAANDRPGATMSIHSALRSLAQQYLLYSWWQNDRCGIALAAKPGTSNHESGLAVDISDNAGWRSEMSAHGFRWLGSSDPVHFDFTGGGTVNIRGRSVKAFQRLWNLNNPNDRIAADGSWGPATAARLRKSPSKGFAIASSCGNIAGTTQLSFHASTAGDVFQETCGL